MGLTTPSLAWNDAAHRVIAAIAYAQLDPATRQNVAALLAHHPAAESLWKDRSENGADPWLNLFANAAIFPDEARIAPWRKFSRSAAHYVNYRIQALQGNRIDPPLEGENLLNSYVAYRQEIEESKSPLADRAVALSWVFHQVGDIHQPLHAVARFAPAWPEGDRGGNQLTVPNSHGSNNLHSYWDGLLGRDRQPAAVAALAAAIQAEIPRASVVEELTRTNVGDWAVESAQASVEVAYRGLDPRLPRIVELPPGYATEAAHLARRRVALAGYRLADELARLFPARESLAALDRFDPLGALAAYTVTFDSPGPDVNATMPLGNGQVGVNAWWEPGGDLCFYVARTDAWDEVGRLVKVGKVRVHLEPNPVVEGVPFEQKLDLASGSIVCTIGRPDDVVKVRLWVDQAHSVIEVVAESPARPRGLSVRLEPWRTAPQTMEYPAQAGGEYTGDPPYLSGETVTIGPDRVPRAEELSGLPWPAVAVVHENGETDWYERTMALQGLEGYGGTDPLEGRIFGLVATVGGSPSAGSQTDDGLGLTAPPATTQRATVAAVTQPTGGFSEWLQQAVAPLMAAWSDPLEERRQTHEKSWRAFWERSWIFVEPTGMSRKEVPADDPTQVVTRGYVLQRFLTAAAGRGPYPIKFNGSLFTVPTPVGGNGNPDYRRWGSGYWWQNTRLPYYSLCASGDTELFEPLIQMYTGDTLDVARYRTRHHLKHDGAFLNECSYFWGAAFNDIYGWNRPANLPAGINLEGWHRWEFTAGYELLWMLLNLYEHTLDPALLDQAILPVAREILTFYDVHYATDALGKIVMNPSQALETWWDCTNPMPDIAGLTAVTSRLLALPESVGTAEDRALWQRLSEKMPPLPTREVDGVRRLAAAERFADKRNVENPELYAVFPFRRIAVGKPDLDLGIAAFTGRDDPGYFGWRQDDAFAAYLGLTEVARNGLVERARKRHEGSRFPAFWGPNYDWIPDQDHGSMLMIALQSMLLQTDGGTIFLAPAWPKDWDVEFRLHAPGRTRIEGSIRDGVIERLSVDPPERRQDIRAGEGWSLPGL